MGLLRKAALGTLLYGLGTMAFDNKKAKRIRQTGRKVIKVLKNSVDAENQKPSRKSHSKRRTQ